MLIGGILLGLVLGLRSGGRLSNLASIQLRWVGLLFAAVLVRFGTETLLGYDIDIVDALRLPLFAAGFAMLLVGLWVNRGYPGLALAFVGILLNAVVVVRNGGYMPIWEASLQAAGLMDTDVTSSIHVVVNDPNLFLTNLLFLGDVIPIPLPVIQNVASLGDVFLTIGLAFFLFAGTVRVPTLLEEAEYDAIKRRLAGLAGSTRLPRDGSTGIAPETGLAPALRETAAMERATFLGGSGGMSSPALAPLPAGMLDTGVASGDALGDSTAAASAHGAAGTTALPLPRISPETMARLRRHPYVRLALNGSFSALWAGQLISLFGDRLHQIALAAGVYLTTGSELASALVFVAAFLPNLVFSPIAGTLVDRWDNKEVLIVSDLLRAATVLLIPMAIVTNVLLVYPFVFVLTTISIFFRPARVAILPRIVRKDELVTANSSLWVGETLADVVGYPLAGLFVLVIGNALPIAFWLDAATYVGSAVLLAGIVVAKPAAAEDQEEEPEAAPTAFDTGVGQGFVAEMRAGYRFLRAQPTLFANTVQASVAQLTVGVLTALTLSFSYEVFGLRDGATVYSFIESSTGVGNLIGGFVIGLVGARLSKGRMISGGYLVWGLLTTVFALSGNLGVVLGLALGSGVANMAFLIPSQALFQELTPAELMGRVVGFRFALVFGAMAVAMAVGGLLTLIIPVTAVIAVFGLVSAAAGLAGFFVPAIRDA